MTEQTTTNETMILRIPATVKSLIEALIFAADEPLTVKQLKAIYEQQNPGGEERHIEQAEIQQVVQALNDEYQRSEKPYRIIAIAGGYQFATMQEYAEWIGRLYKEQSRRRLSQSSLETLSIVAYKQPVSKPEIEAIRGVNCDYVLHTLLEKELVTIVGRAETVGRPLLYGTTREFLKHFGLNDVTDLPRPREIEEILGESQFETERRMLEAQEGADQTKKEEEDFKSRLPHIPKKKVEMDETVQIIPRKKSRELHLRPREEEKKEVSVSDPNVNTIPDEKAIVQEEMKEPPEESANQSAAEKTKSENLKVQDIMEEVEAESVTDASESVIEPPAEVEMQHPASPAITVPAVPFDSMKLANENQSYDVGEAAPPVNLPPVGLTREPEKTQPRKRTWSQWKEKIQSFIRKLFG